MAGFRFDHAPNRSPWIAYRFHSQMQGQMHPAVDMLALERSYEVLRVVS